MKEVRCPCCNTHVLSHYHTWFYPPIEHDIQCTHCKEWLELSRSAESYIALPFLIIANVILWMLPGFFIFVCTSLPMDSLFAWTVYVGVVLCLPIRFMILDYRPQVKIAPGPTTVIYVTEDNEDL